MAHQAVSISSVIISVSVSDSLKLKSPVTSSLSSVLITPRSSKSSCSSSIYIKLKLMKYVNCYHLACLYVLMNDLLALKEMT